MVIGQSSTIHWYAIDETGITHRFENSNDGKMHWNGDTSQGRGVGVPADVKARLEKIKKDGKAVRFNCKCL